MSDVRMTPENPTCTAAFITGLPFADCKRCKRIWSGDWLKRHSAAEGTF